MRMLYATQFHAVFLSLCPNPSLSLPHLSGAGVKNYIVSQEDLFGQGPVCASCHVMINKEFSDKIEPPFEHEIDLLKVRVCEKP